MTSRTRIIVQVHAAAVAVALLAGCATTKQELPPIDKGPIGDVDAGESAAAPVTPATAPRKGGLYRDPLVTTGHDRSAATAATQKNVNLANAGTPTSNPAQQAAPTQVAEQTVAMNQREPEATATSGAPHHTGLYAAQPQQTATDSAPANSIVPPDMPSRPFQATVNSVYSLQKQPQSEPQMPANPTAQPAAAAPVVVTQRPPTKAEILAGLAPDPKKRRQAPRANQQPVTMPSASPSSEIVPGMPAQLQASLPGGVPGAANTGGLTEMDKIQGAPEATGMTKDSFIKKFLAKIRK